MNNNMNNNMPQRPYRVNNQQPHGNRQPHTKAPRKLKWGRIIVMSVIALWLAVTLVIGAVTEIKFLGGLFFSDEPKEGEIGKSSDDTKDGTGNSLTNNTDPFVTSGSEGSTSNNDDSSKNKIIVLDAGHGGKDDGASYSGFNEKDINLAICLKVKEILTSKKYDVRLTRSDDTFVEKADRADMANNLGAAVFVSFHCNSYTGTGSVSGTEVYYSKLNESYAGGSKLGEFILYRIVEFAGQKDRGVRDYDYAVIKRTKMPAVLIEMGYMTNKYDLDILTTDSGQDKMANSIAEGIVDYMKTL